MKAVILASGLARRMGGLPKGLVRVGGREILYRSIHLLREQGIREFVLVVNRWNERAYRQFMEEAFGDEIEWKLVMNDAPERENGYSLHLVRSHLEGPFVLTMADHVYSRKFVDRAFRLHRGSPSAVIDEHPLHIDLEEATRVKCSGGRISKVAKNLEDYDAVDTGFFFLDDGVFDITASLLSEGVLPLSRVIEELKPECIRVSGEAWMDVDTKGDIRRATWMLIRDATKGKGDGWISRSINRPISRLITFATVEHLTPNTASILSFAIGILSSIIALLHPPSGALLYQFHSILDGVDGEIARVRLMESRVGGWMDSILDRVVDFSFLLALAFHLKPGVGLLPWIMAAVFGTVMVSYVSERFRGAFCRDPYQVIPYLRWMPGRRDERIFLIMLMVLAGMIPQTFVAIGLLTILKSTWNFAWMMKWARKPD